MKFFTVLRYTLKGSNAFFFRGKRGGYLPIVLSIVFFTLAFGFPVYIVNYEGFRKIVSFGVEEITVLSISFWSFSISILSIAGLSPHVVYSLNFSEEALFLSTLPVSKFSLVLNSFVISTLSNTLLPIAYIFGMMGYSAAVGLGALKALIPALSNVLLVMSAALFLSVAISRWAGPGIRRLNLYVFLLDLILVVVMIQLNPVTLGTARFARAVSRLRFMWTVLTSRYNPFYWPILALTDPIYEVPILVLSAVFIALSRFASERIDLTRTGAGVVRSRLKPIGLFSKDLRLFQRKEQNFFFVMYPLIFSILYGHFTKSPRITVSINAVFSIFYTSVMAAINTQMEIGTYPFHRTLPISPWKILFPKLAIPVIVYSTLNLVVSIYALFSGLKIGDFVLSILFMTLAYVFSSIMGMREFLRKPTSGRVILPITSVFKVEFLSVGAVFSGFVYPLMWKNGGGIFRKWEILDRILSSHGTLITVALMITFSVIWLVESIGIYKNSDT